MKQPATIRALWMLAALVGLANCGASDETVIPDPPEVAACKEFCEAAQSVGCPKRGDCLKDCAATAALGCVDAFVDLLRCAGPQLTSECVPRDVNGTLTCVDALTAYDSCLPIDVGYPLESCGESTAESEAPSKGCEGALTCGAETFSVACDGEGSCTCSKNGDAVGACSSILSSAYLCAPHRSCCAPFFAPD